jgi:AcrR family transcriptional regulator
MPPKKRFEEITVIEAAFHVLCREGFQAVTARSVAAELGSSTTPIYWVLESMDKVEEALLQKTMQLMIEYQSKKYTENIFINMAIGYVNFARQEPRLFQFLQLEHQKPLDINQQAELGERVEAILGEKPPYENYFGQIDQKSMDTLTLQSWIFTHGLAVAVSSHMLKFESEKEIEDLLVSAGSAFYLQQISKNKK